MNKFKNITSLFLIIILLVTVFNFNVTVSAETDTAALSTETDTRYDEAINIVKALGIISDTTNLDDVVTRKDYIKMVYELMGSPSASIDKTIFNDVSSSSPYAKYVNWASYMGLISAGEDKMFYPDEPILYQQAVKVMVSSLGYTLMAEEMGGYPSGYLVKANSLGLLKKMKSGSNDSITKKEALQLIYNAMEVPILQVKNIGKTVSFSVVNDDNVLSVYHNIFKDKGQVTANERSSLFAGGRASQKGSIKINNTQFSTPNHNLQNYLGYEVSYYYHRDTDQEENIILYMDIESQDIITVDAGDIDARSTIKEFIYNEGDEENTVNISEDADLIYNGVARSLNDDYLVKPVDGSVTLLDSNDDGVYDIVNTTSYVTYFVNNVNGEISLVSDRYVQSAIELDNNNKSVLFDIVSDGKSIGIDELSSYDILSVAASSDYIDSDGIRKVDAENSTYYNIIVSNEYVNGTIDETSDDSITIQGKEYKYSNYFNLLLSKNKVESIQLGDIVTVYMNYNNEISGVDGESFQLQRYGFLINAGITKGLDQNVEIKILNEDGNILVMKCLDKVEFDGKSGVDAQGLYSNLTDAQGTVKRQLIGYKTDKNGKVRFIDTKEVDFNGNRESSLTEDVNMTLKYKSTHCFEDAVILPDKAKIFVVPQTDTGNDKDYAVNGFDYFSNDTLYAIAAYNVGRANICNLILVYGTTSEKAIDLDTKIAVIEKVSNVVDADGMPITQMTGMSNFVKFKLALSNTLSVLDYEVLNPDGTPTRISYSDLNRGDIVRYATNNQGEISRIERTLDYSKQNLYRRKGVFVDGYRLLYGQVYDLYNGSIQLVFNSADLNNGQNSAAYNISRAKIYVYDKKKKTVELVTTTQDIITYRDCKDAALTSYVAVHTRYGDIVEIVIYK